MKHKTLKAFTKAVNDLARSEAVALNADGGYAGMFKAAHIDFPECLCEYYFDDGYTPREMLDKMTADAEWENACEARMS